MITPTAALRELWHDTTGTPLDRAGVVIDGDDPVLPSRYRVGVLAAAAVAATATAAARLLRARGGAPDPVRLSVREAAAAFHTERCLRVDGAPPRDLWAALSGNYRAADGWVRLHCNYPHHRDAVLAALAVADSRDAVAEAVSRRTAEDVEAAVLAAGGAAGALRRRADWLRHPQALAIGRLPLADLRRLGPAPARPLARADRPLAGVRVLDLTHVIAGPVCGRTLAAFGADVLHVGAAHLPTVGPLVIDTGFGKRSCHLDLRTERDRLVLRGLIAEADVFVQSYRPGALAALGFGPAQLAELRPGIVSVNLSAYGQAGPLAGRRGFDSLVQMVSGIADTGEAAPRQLPAQTLDHGTGWLAAFGAITALTRRASAGGSWEVRVSLARTALWLDSLGRTEDEGERAEGVEDFADLLVETDSAFGRLTHVRAPASGYWAHGPRLPGGDEPQWW
ncbi:CoA transferase [Solihabitans fulvus]|uniref:CoA transferase n=1 Tax=Solihabitans fulvus TaxID=1892852 RepID=UPI001CB761D8|nr:CoA transferase [Solihabitans fulvus]